MPLSAVELTLHRQLLESICAELGRVLQQGAYSPNIKERRDFSTALFDAHGRMVAQGQDIPVHLGSMPASVAAALNAHQLERGDIVLLNDPYRGGTHLPDITAIAPYFEPGGGAPAALVANRAHHADVGGLSAGSLPMSRELFHEGVIIPPVKVVRRGRAQHDLIELVCANSRTPQERRADLHAQFGSLRRGLERLSELSAALSGKPHLQTVFAALLESSAAAAAELIATLPSTPASGSATLELENRLATIRVRIAREKARLIVDFSGTDAQQPGPFNAVRAITVSAVFYALRCLLPPEVATTSGLLHAVTVITEPGTLVDALHPAAVAAGNVETSQRIVLAVFDALSKLLPGRIPAASQGTMNNLLIGATSGAPFTYYETIAGGHGASAAGAGLSARHSHMTNSLNTPVEALEHAYPLRVWRYSIRRNNGGNGVHAGGDGIVREVEFLRNCEFTLLRQSVAHGPAGSQGGRPGQPGQAMLTSKLGAEELPASCTRTAASGDRLVLETPGGGGFGAKRSGQRRAGSRP
jgi:N-methylhydantoinase B